MQHILAGEPRSTVHSHETVADARACQEFEDYRREQDDADAMAEAAAELAWERHLEDRGYWDAREDEDLARAMGALWY